MKIIGFAGSNSKNSINKELVKYIGSQLTDVEFELLDLNNFEMPIYSIDRQTENGFPKEATAFYNKLEEADAVVVSLAEHNGNFATGLKNILDWISRIKMNYLQDKPLLLLATSPGPNGAKSVLEIGFKSFTYAGSNIVSKVSFPSFHENFKEGSVTNEDLKNLLSENITNFVETYQSNKVSAN